DALPIWRRGAVVVHAHPARTGSAREQARAVGFDPAALGNAIALPRRIVVPAKTDVRRAHPGHRVHRPTGGRRVATDLALDVLAHFGGAGGRRDLATGGDAGERDLALGLGLGQQRVERSDFHAIGRGFLARVRGG